MSERTENYNVRYADMEDECLLYSYGECLNYNNMYRFSVNYILRYSTSTEIVICIKDDIIIGSLIMYKVPYIFGQKNAFRVIISDVYVLEKFRNQGVGKALINFVLEKTKDIEHVQIDGVRLDNEIAFKLYEPHFPKKEMAFIRYNKGENKGVIA